MAPERAEACVLPHRLGQGFAGFWLAPAPYCPRLGVGGRCADYRDRCLNRAESILETVAALPGAGQRARRDPYDIAALLLLFGIFVLVLATFTDYGTTWDEDYHFWYAFKVLDYYRSFFHDTTALTSPPISYYGALFDGATALLSSVSPASPAAGSSDARSAGRAGASSPRCCCCCRRPITGRCSTTRRTFPSPPLMPGRSTISFVSCRSCRSRRRATSSSSLSRSAWGWACASANCC